MAFTPMVFDKDWTNPDHFPTHENREAQVRADIQYLFNFIRDHFNNFITNELTSANIPFTLDEAQMTAQEAFTLLEDQIKKLAVGEAVLPAGCVTTEKLEDNAVTSDKIENGAVVSGKLGEGAVGTSNIVDNSITKDKMTNNSVGTDELENYCVNENKLANGAVITQRIRDYAVTTAKLDNLSVTDVKLANGAVAEAKIANNAVTTPKIKDLNVTTAKIANGAVTYEKTTGLQRQHTIVGPINIPFGDWLKYVKEIPPETDGEDPTTEEITYTAHEAYLAAMILEETGEEMTWEEYETWFTQQMTQYEADYAQYETDHAAWEEAADPEAEEPTPPTEPVKLVDEYTKDEIKTLDITVSGVSLANVDTQMVNYLPSTDLELMAMGDAGMRCLRVPPAENKVTVKVENVPEIDINLYFDILD